MKQLPQTGQRVSERNPIESLRVFLARYKRWKQEQPKEFAVVVQFLQRFRAGHQELVRAERNWESSTAPHFNIFRALRIQRRETKLHSRFLAELLDPYGSHSQGDWFLNGFLEIAQGCGLHGPTGSWRPSDWQVRTEDAVKESDRLDIVLRCLKNGGFIAVIENKVDAREQDEQCDRYAKWLDEQREFELRELIFLTPDGHSPQTDKSGRWVCMSYREHIKNWLQAAMRERSITAPHLRIAIEQYLQIVETL